MYKIIDNNGEIYSGGEEEMDNIFSIMTTPGDHTEEEIERYNTDWTGDLQLIHVIAISA